MVVFLMYLLILRFVRTRSAYCPSVQTGAEVEYEMLSRSGLMYVMCEHLGIFCYLVHEQHGVLLKIFITFINMAGGTYCLSEFATQLVLCWR
jgi:hypothetical protein